MVSVWNCFVICKVTVGILTGISQESVWTLLGHLEGSCHSPQGLRLASKLPPAGPAPLGASVSYKTLYCNLTGIPSVSVK